MPVVYSGVSGSGQGDLFQGLKLWVAHRVPQRARWVDLVKGNGGEVVRLEKTADMLIADNIKVAGLSPPPGSYMWRWIDDSVKNGFLQDKDDYLIGRRQGSAREAGTSQQTKVGRTNFSTKDDLILTKWMVAEEMMGNVLSGTVTYKALETKYPHHTWQSWRDRWVKTIKNRPRPTFSDEEIQAEIDQHRGQSPEPARGPSGSSRHAQPNLAAAVQPQPPSTQNGPAKSPVRAPVPAYPTSSDPLMVKGRTFFTKEEDQLLLDYIEEVRRNNRENGREDNKNLGGNVIYQAIAEKHPTHPWQSWRDRWVRHLSLIEAVDDAGPDEASSADPGEARHLRKRRIRQPRVNGGVEAPAPNGSPRRAPGPSSSMQQSNPKSDEQRLKKKLCERRETRAAVLIEKTWRGHAVRRDMARLEADVVTLQSLMRGYVARMRMASLAAETRRAGIEPGEIDFSQDDDQYQDAEEDLQEADLGSNGMLVEDRDPREQFYDDLQVVLEAIDVRIDSQPTINGQRIDLWDLYRLASQQDCELEARDWKLVAEGLGFEPVNGLVWRVQACYLQNLAEFEHHIKTFERNNSMDGDEVEEEESRRDAPAEHSRPTSDFATAPKQPIADPSSPVYRSSPPIAGSKRFFENNELLRSDSGYPSSGPRKRRRVDRNSIIPPTPDEKLGLANNSLGGPAMQGKSSPLKSKALVNGDLIELSSEDGFDELLNEDLSDGEGQNELPTRSNRAKKRFVEPETQDWHIPRDHFFLDSEDDVSPSQQLHLESDAAKSPRRVGPRNQNAFAEEDHLSSPAAENVEGLRGPTTRVLRSKTQRAAVPATIASSSRAPVNGTVKKRTLPASYQSKTASTNAATSTASVPNGKIVLQSQPQHNGTSLAHAFSAAPVRTTKDDVSRQRQNNPDTPMPAARSSNSRSLAFSPAAPPQLIINEEAAASQESVTLDEAHVEAQLSHFQALGYKNSHIHRAMEAATMSRGPMVVALNSLSNGDGLPQHEPGVWTPRDCSDLRRIKKYEQQVGKGKGIAGPTDSKIKVVAWRLEEKHGKGNMDTRWEFMQLVGQTQGV